MDDDFPVGLAIFAVLAVWGITAMTCTRAGHMWEFEDRCEQRCGKEMYLAKTPMNEPDKWSCICMQPVRPVSAEKK
jgi:hypothetical protein